jgi:penicillin amidase
MKAVKFLLSAAGTILLLVALSMKWGDVPPLGQFLSPATGFWKNAEPKMPRKQATLNTGMLNKEVLIRYDSARIPHVFAKDEYGLYFAQGYVTARDRLWQMDIQARTAGGRMAEVLGPPLLEQDRYYRRKGLPLAADRMLQELRKDTAVYAALSAYTDGVNAYIRSLSAARLPVEFKLMDYQPDDWTPLKSVLIFKLMDDMLSGGSDDFGMTGVRDQFGKDIAESLFPDNDQVSNPVIPAGTPWDFTPVDHPVNRSVQYSAITDTIRPRSKIPGAGSNSWTVTGSRSASGYPLLANDPHLGLSLPSVWYQIQMATPGMNVYGVSIPGIPNIIIGFNEQLAWGLTNTEADVVDWYKIVFRDSTRTAYLYDGKWLPVEKRVEKMAVRGEEIVADTILYTKHGPVIYFSGSGTAREENSTAGRYGYALHWVSHEPSSNFRTFYLLNHARNLQDYRTALKNYTSPAQNFIYCDKANNIALTVNGKFPLRYRGQGKYLLDGASRQDDWYGFIPYEHNPFVMNPSQGFISSANQPVTDSTYPYYISWQYGPEERAQAINNYLKQTPKATVEDFKAMQTSNKSGFAADVLPAMLEVCMTDERLSAYRKELDILRQWNFSYDANASGGTIFSLWWQLLYNGIWKDDFNLEGKAMRWPTFQRTISLLKKEQTAEWFDDRTTPVKEQMADIISTSFKKTIDSLRSTKGPLSEQWNRGTARPLYINHIAGIPGLGQGTFATGGDGYAINALSDNLGPSWRMVVELGPEIRAYGVIPGGASGNPGSFYYDNTLNAWLKGELLPLLFLRSDTALPAATISSLILH